MKRIIFLLVFLLMAYTVSARDYSLDSAFVNVTVFENGIVYVEKSISYSFSGTYYEVFDDIYFPTGGSIENIQGYCEPGCTFRIDSVPGGRELVGELKQPCPEKVTFHVSYYYTKLLLVHNDISELHIQLWGNGWEKQLGKLEGEINLPANVQAYYLHPEERTISAKSRENTLEIQAAEIPANQWYEARVLFTRLPDAEYAAYYSDSGLEQINAIESEYSQKVSQSKYLALYVLPFLVVYLLLLFLIYLKYGREPKVSYNALYEREPPTKAKPAIVNALVHLGQPSIDAFTATVMDLVYRDYLEIRTISSKKLFFASEDFEITIKGKDTTGLAPFEKKVLALFKENSTQNSLIYSEFRKKLSTGTEFYKFMSSWNSEIKKGARTSEMFQIKGTVFAFLLSLAVGIGSIVFLVAYLAANYPLSEFPAANAAYFLAGGLAATALPFMIISIVSPEVFGRFTPKGRVTYLKWKNFSKYMTDFSLLKEHPPESVKIWDFYMVYAVALGVADKARKNMKLIVPQKDINRSVMIIPSHAFSSGFHSAYTASAPHSSGGVAGVGGGGGGGGGGAR